MNSTLVIIVAIIINVVLIKEATGLKEILGLFKCKHCNKISGQTENCTHCKRKMGNRFGQYRNSITGVTVYLDTKNNQYSLWNCIRIPLFNTVLCGLCLMVILVYLITQ